uniref:NADH-ubiquinone oxidoreductase chain 6 n=1 Tax=Pempheris schwenkii TaxID=463600 RepID=A0A0B6VJT7_9TELE|nr:NADH dehydrogenase subunit 6 [Pempheris schwenkii]BAQ20953.1 NADH dehydrogenase subunit 6 [Pempheris schwenkii]
MTYMTYLLMGGLVLGSIGVASNPSPYFAAFGLVLVSGMGCGVLAEQGGSFLSLVLFLIYLGGMLVVFAYSAALAAEPYPESWGEWKVLSRVLGYVIGVVSIGSLFWGGWHEFSGSPGEQSGNFSVLGWDTTGVGEMYHVGGPLLVVSAWVLLLTLFVVLELVRGFSRGALRAV